MPQGWTRVAEPAQAPPKGWTPVAERAAPRPEDALRKATGIGADPARTIELAPVMGVPIASMGGIGAAARGVQAAAGMAGKAVEGAKAVGKLVTPVVEYEVVNQSLQAVGVPAAVSVPIAMMVSGRKAVPKRAPRAPRTTASPAPAASPPAVPAPATAPAVAEAAAVPSAARGPSPQMIRNQVGLASRQSGLKLSEEQMAAADALVATGRAPMDAVRVVAAQAPAAPVAPPVAPKPKLNAAEASVYVRLRSAGKSHQEAMQAVEVQRELAQRLGLPSSETVRTTVGERNRTGRWPSGN